MLDTIILQMDLSRFHIFDYEKFGTTKEEILNIKKPFFKWQNNPTKEDKENNVYKPRLTLIKRGLGVFLKIEFSAPKLLFRNNIDELSENDFDKVVANLREKSKEMGVWLLTRDIEEAKVLSFHPSKNMPLKNGYTANMAIKELNKLDFSKRFDLDVKDYKNNGEVLQLYTRSHSLVIYDKINDLRKPAKRATDKDQTKYQMSIFDFIKENHQRLELLRIEVRLSLKQKMDKVLERLGYAPNPLFKDIFKKDLCKKILRLYWNDFFSDNIFIFSTTSSPQEILQLILRLQPETKILKAIAKAGIYMLCRDEEGMRGFRQIVEAYKPKANWAVVKRSIKEFEDEMFSNPSWGFIKDIKQELANFKPFRLDLHCKE